MYIPCTVYMVYIDMCMLKQFAISFANSVCITWPTVNVQMYLHVRIYMTYIIIHAHVQCTCTYIQHVHVHTYTLWDALCCFVKSIFTTFTSAFAYMYMYITYSWKHLCCACTMYSTAHAEPKRERRVRGLALTS